MNGLLFRQIPPVTKNLIIINFIVWLAMLIVPSRIDVDVLKYGGLHYFTAPDFNPAQLFTYLFMHDTRSFAHLFFNMFTLWMFGVTLERVMGSARFLFYYMSVGVGAALFQELVWSFIWEGDFVKRFAMVAGMMPDQVRELMHTGVIDSYVNSYLNSLITIGASGSIYGILLGFGMLFPNRRLFLLFFPVPIKAKWMVMGYGVIEVLLGITSAGDGVAHFAHLGGMLFGFLLIYYWKKKGVVYGDPF